MEKKNSNLKIEVKRENYSLYDDLSKLEGVNYIVILDFYHDNCNNDEEFIIKNLQTIKELCYLDFNILYIIFCKSCVMEESRINTKNYITQFLNEYYNIFYEEKLSNLQFISGFLLAKKSTVYIFTDGNSKNINWIKMKDKIYEKMIKYSDFEFMKVTLEYMLREKKRNYEIVNGKQPSKLLLIFEGNNPKDQNRKTETNKFEKTDNIDKVITNSNKFHVIIENIKNYLIKSPPRNFENIKNIIFNFSEQNINIIIKNLQVKLDIDHLSFLILKELIDREIIINRILRKIIDQNLVTCINDVSSLICFYVNLQIDNDSKLYNENQNQNTHIEHQNIQNGTDNYNMNKQPKTHRKKKKLIASDFSISDTAEEDYKNLVSSCPTICEFIRKTIMKILSNFTFHNIDKLPTNPSKYKNHIASYTNNQELLKICKKLLNMDYDNILKILTEGIMIELMRSNLVIILSDKKIHYNIKEIEFEKFRLTQLNNIIN